MATRGKRAGSRRASRRRPSLRSWLRPSLLGLALGVTLAVVGWGYLVRAAIDFGAAARGGDGRAWTYLGVAGLGAVACLFVGLMLVARLLRQLGLTRDPSAPPAPPAAPRPVGGRRAAR